MYIQHTHRLAVVAEHSEGPPVGRAAHQVILQSDLPYMGVVGVFGVGGGGGVCVNFHVYTHAGWDPKVQLVIDRRPHKSKANDASIQPNQAKPNPTHRGLY